MDLSGSQLLGKRRIIQQFDPKIPFTNVTKSHSFPTHSDYRHDATDNKKFNLPLDGLSSPNP